MASFTQRLKVVIDVVSQGATKGLSDFRSEVAQADTFTGKLRAGAKNLGSTLTSFTKSPLGAATAITAVAASAYKAAEQFSTLAKTALDVGKATGLGTEAASRWIAVADDAGVSAEQFAAGAARISRSLEAGKFEKYGIATRDAAGNIRSANDILLDTLDLLGRTPNETQRAAIGAELLGKGWASLAPLLGKSRSEYEQLLGVVSDGQVITDGEVAKGEQWRLAMDRLQDAMKDVGTQAGELVVELAPLIEATAAIIEPLGSVFDFTGLTDTTEKPLADLSKRLSKVGESTYLTGVAMEEFGVAYARNLNTLDQAALFATVANMSELETNAHLTRQAFGSLATTMPEAAGQVLDSMSAILLAASRGDKASITLAHNLGLSVPLLSELKTLVPGYTSATEDSTDATEDNAEAIKAQRDAFEQANRKMADQLELKRKLYGDQRDAIERQREFNDAQAELYYTMADGESTTRDQVDAIIKLSEEFGTLTGASLDSEEGTKRQILKLEELMRGVAPGSPLYIALSEYIGQLKAIPSNVDTQLRLNVIGAVTTRDGDLIGLREGQRALGGPVDAGSLYQVGEGGRPELLTDAMGRSYLIPGSDGVVTPIGAAAGIAGAGGGMTFNITIAKPMINGEQLANELKAYIRRHGSGWLNS